MKRRTLFGLLLTTGLGLLVLPDGAAGQEKSLQHQLVGTWRSVSVVATRPDGSKLEPFGANVRGGLIFTAAGHIALINTRSDIPKIASNNRAQGTPEEYQVIMRGTHAFFGTYKVDEAARSFIISPISSTFPNEIGGTSKRTVTAISASELKFTYPVGPAVVEQVWLRQD